MEIKYRSVHRMILSHFIELRATLMDVSSREQLAKPTEEKIV
jgi:hypothetical protein